MPELVVQELTKRFGGAPAVEDVSFTVADGEFFTLLGPSGCGKSTTLSSIAGLIQPDCGVITVGDTVFVDTAARKHLSPERRNLGMVFQSYALWPHMTVADNLAVPLKLRRLRKADRKQRIEAVLDQVGLAEMAGRYPHQLSGGQQQRVALARALVYSPSVLLLDEPLSNLDAKLRDRARTWLKQLQDEVGITTLYVTHDQLEALSLSDRIAVMGDNKVLQVGSPRDIYERPATPEVASFVGRCNFLEGQVRESDPHAELVVLELGDAPGPVRVRSAETFAPGSTVTVAVRAEKLEPREPAGDGARGEDNVLRMRVRSESYVGARYEYQLEFGDQMVTAESVSSLGVRDVDVVLPVDGCVLFAERVERTVVEPVST